MAEKNYEFRKRMLEVHKKDMRDDSVWPKYEGLVIDGAFEIVFDEAGDRVGRYAAYDMMEYFRDSMGMYLRVRGSGSIAEEAASPAGKIILADKAALPAFAPSDAHISSNRIVVKDGGVIVCGNTGRGTAQGVYELESRMNGHCGPVLEEGEWDRKPLFSPRMIHSGYGLDMYPDEHIRAIAHAGMDAILIFVKDVDKTAHGYLDFNELIERAGKYGVDVYAYSYLRSDLHPDDPGARAHYESTYGKLFRHCPGLRGVTLVGESCEFPSKDPRTVPYHFGEVNKENNPKGLLTPGWIPCNDYPQWVALVRDIVRQYNPEADFVFWTYNWGWAPEKARRALIKNLPTDISLQATYEMFETFDHGNGVHSRITDYSLSFAGPGKYFSSEADEASKKGIPLYAMSNTGGLSWDIGVIPYEPCPDQWRRRWDGLIEAHDKQGLRGLMESHHFGFWPSFISEMAREHYWSPRASYEEILRRIVVRDFTEANADTAIEALNLFSEGVRTYVSTDEDQYGPFRVGPAYPLLYQDKADLPDVPYAHFGHRICNTMYTYDLDTKRETFMWEIGRAETMRDLYRKGTDLLISFRNTLSGRRLDTLDHLIALGDFITRCAQTTVNVKQWYLRKWKLVREQGDHEELIRQMREIGEAEIENAKGAIPLVEYDSRLGYEPSMEYMCDRAHLEWKIDITRRAMEALDEPVRDNPAKHSLGGIMFVESGKDAFRRMTEEMGE